MTPVKHILLAYENTTSLYDLKTMSDVPFLVLAAASDLTSLTPQEQKQKEIFDHIRLLKSQGNLLEARAVSMAYIKENPGDLDAKVLLASIYNQLNDFKSAKELLQAVLKKSPKEADAIELMQKVEADESAFKAQAAEASTVTTKAPSSQTRDTYLSQITHHLAAEQYKDALALSNNALKEYPNDADFLQAKNKAEYGLGEFNASNTPVITASTFSPQNLQATEVLNAIVSDTGKHYGPNQLGINQQSIYGTSPDSYWNFTNLYYTHDANFGMVLASLNHASRFGYSALQFSMESIVNLSKYFYLDVNVAYANNLNLFPNWTLGSEGYFSIPKWFDFSLGDLYRNVNPTYFNTYTGSLSKDISDYWLSFRPYVFVPQSGSTSVLYTVTARRYLDSPDHFISMTLGYGVTPDLADLQSTNFITLDDKSASVTYQHPLLDHRMTINIGASYENQVFPSGTVRQLTGIDIGFKSRF